MPVTATDIVNQALMMIGDNQPPVTGNSPNFDLSTAGKAAAKLYAPCVATVQRQYEWDASRNTIALVPTGNVAPFPWSFEYAYPPNGIEVWQVMVATGDAINDPTPSDFQVANDAVGGNQVRVVLCNDANALAVYNNNPREDAWDAGFREAVVRLLASELATAIAGSPDVTQALLESGGAFGQAASERQD